MQEGSLKVLQRLLYHTHPDNFDSYLKYFEERDRMQLAALPKVETPLALHLDNPQDMLHQIHYSWFLKSFDQLPKSLHKALVQVFSKEQADRLKKMLRIENTTKKNSPCLNAFLVQWFLKEIQLDQQPPTCFLTHSRFFYLLKIHKNDWVALIHQLGVYDLANMSKKIVDKKLLKEMSKLLTSAQKKLFTKAQKSLNDPIPSSYKDLRVKLEDDRTFRSFLEKRGILRLAMALASESSLFVWHLAHVLDRGRGEEFLSVMRRCSTGPHTAYYAKQLAQLCEPYQEKMDIA